MKQAYGMACGHCGHALRIRTSEGATQTLRVLFFQCTNELCGATYRGYAEVTHQYSPSGQANASFNLPPPDSATRARDKTALALLAGETQADLFDTAAANNDNDQSANGARRFS